MDHLPVDVASIILADACFGDQATACSLALTSKWVGQVVKPVRFEALSLYGLPQIVRFAQMLEGMPPAYLRSNTCLYLGESTVLNTRAS